MSDNTTLNTESVLHTGPAGFEQTALDIFRLQHEHNAVYRAYCDALHIDKKSVIRLTDIPFLPIAFFKTHKVITDFAAGEGQADWNSTVTSVGQARGSAPTVFESSGTTGTLNSKHYVADTALYEKSLLLGFEAFYGPPRNYAVLALLPSYLERKNASLVHMAGALMEQSGHADNGFYINEWEQLHATLVKLEQGSQKVLLLGVTFALLDFAEAYPTPLANTIVMETGGMKGRKEELTRNEVHAILKKQWQLKQVHSEYGMTELLSQAYAKEDGIFKCTNTMRVFVRDVNDPLEVKECGTGALNITDLANIYSCSFIATEDIGTLAADGSFEVLGRLDHSTLRGCSLMAV